MLYTRLKVVLATFLLLLGASSAKSISLLRDSDIENSLKELAQPILNAAGINSSNFQILVVDSATLNAFVIDQNHIFIHSGLILKLSSAAQLQAVIAHEAAHIANGHIARRMTNTRKAKITSTFGTLIAIAAAAGGQSNAGFGIALGTANSANRVLLAHTRNEESSADRSAVHYLNEVNLNSNAMIEVFKIFEQQINFSLKSQDPYTRSHPLDRDRINALTQLTSTHPNHSTSPENKYFFSRLHTKLAAFTNDPGWGLEKPTSNAHLDLMQKAISNHRLGQVQEAINFIGNLVTLKPKDPYYRELQGQILLENRKYSEAINAYRSATKLAPNDPLILGGYGKALLTQNKQINDIEALKVLKIAQNLDSKDANILYHLGRAFSRAGKIGEASLATAQRYALQGDIKNAILQAKRAEAILPRGSVAWQNTQDIIYGF